MKSLLVLPIALFLFTKTNAQSAKWMYLSDSRGITLIVDTLKNDIEQPGTYNGRNNVVLIWAKAINKRGGFVGSVVLHYAIDTTNKQIETLSVATYHADSLIQSKTYDHLPWEDVIPESNNAFLIIFCRALYNRQLMHLFILNAEWHNAKPTLQKQKSG